MRALQSRKDPHQIKKGTNETNTSDVLRTGEGQTATRGREPLSRFRRLDARGEKLDELGAIGEYGSKGFVTINELGIA